MNDTQLKFKASGDQKYKVNCIQDSAIYAKMSKKKLPGIYYLVLWKSYSDKKNI